MNYFMLKRSYIVDSLNEVIDNPIPTKNSIKSTGFIEKLGETIQNKLELSDCEILCQRVKEGGVGQSSGEWLFDLVICKKTEVEEKEERESGRVYKTDLYYDLKWAVECEYGTNLKETVKDFSKILIARSENILYLNGYASLSDKKFQDYQDRRIKTIESILKKIEIKEETNLFYYFWPSPEKKNECESFWNNEKSRLLEIVKLFKYNNISKKLEPVDE